MTCPQRRAHALALWLRGQGWVGALDVAHHLRDDEGLTRGSGYLAIRQGLDDSLLVRRLSGGPGVFEYHAGGF